MTARIKGNILTIDGVESRLSPPELTVLWAVMARKYVPEDDLVEMLWPHPDGMPDYWGTIINMKMHSLRIKLKPAGWGIKKLYGKPWCLVEV